VRISVETECTHYRNRVRISVETECTHYRNRVRITIRNTRRITVGFHKKTEGIKREDTPSLFMHKKRIFLFIKRETFYS